jgi:hypothetical protein
LDLISGILDEKHKCMGYDTDKHPKTRDADKKKRKQMVRCTVLDDEDSSKIEELSDDEELDARRTDF